MPDETAKSAETLDQSRAESRPAASLPDGSAGDSNRPADTTPSTQDHPKRALSNKTPSKDTAPAAKIENRPVVVQGLGAETGEIAGNSSQPAGDDTDEAPEELEPVDDDELAPDGPDTVKEDGRGEPDPDQGELDGQAKADDGKIAGITPSPTLPRIKPRQHAFLRYLLDPESPTYNNQTESYKRAYKDARSYQGAASSACATLKSPKVASWIDAILQKVGANVEDRVSDLAAIAANRTTPRRVKRQVLDKDGRRRTLIDEYEPSHAERVKAHDIINKLSGDYDQTRHNNRIAETEYKAVLNHTLREIRADNKARSRDVTPTTDKVVEKEGGRGTEALGHTYLAPR